MSQENVFSHLKGLSVDFDPNYFTLEFDEINLIIHQVKIKLVKNQPLKTFNIPFENIVTLDMVTETDLTQNNALGNGIAGAILFGPVGAVIGGMSGMAAKKIPCFAISYISKSTPSEIKTVIFNSSAVAGTYPRNKKFVDTVKEVHGRIKRSELVANYLMANNICEPEMNADGSITL